MCVGGGGGGGGGFVSRTQKGWYHMASWIIEHTCSIIHDGMAQTLQIYHPILRVMGNNFYSLTIDNNYVTGIGNAIILRHHPCNALSASRARVEKWSGSVHWQSFTRSPRSRATGSNYTVIQ